MNGYKPNPVCTCERCRRWGLMGPVMLITVGTLFLVANYTRYEFSDLWPVILIVAGVLHFLRSSASVTSHRDRYAVMAPPAPSTAAAPAPTSTRESDSSASKVN